MAVEFAHWDSYARFARYVRLKGRCVLGVDERVLLGGVDKFNSVELPFALRATHPSRVCDNTQHR
jgi:hypothetical protein